MERPAVNAPQDSRSVTRAPMAGSPMPGVAALPVASRTALQARAEQMLVRAVPQVKYQLMRGGPARGRHRGDSPAAPRAPIGACAARRVDQGGPCDADHGEAGAESATIRGV